jgi:hypothetical protein
VDALDYSGIAFANSGGPVPYVNQV